MKSKLSSKQTLNTASISLMCLFQVLTACCIFFACLRISPLLALVGTIVVAPAVIRTGIAADMYLRAGELFSWRQRVYCFVESAGIVVLTLLLAIVVSAAISLTFGFFTVGLSMLYGVKDSLMDIAVIGTAGGMLWGMGGAMLAICATARIWKVHL